MTLKNRDTLVKLKRLIGWKNDFIGMECPEIATYRDSNLYVKQCAVCNQNKKGNRTPRSSLGSYHAGYPMERVHLVILGPINPRSRPGSSYILVTVDQFTKWVELATPLALPLLRSCGRVTYLDLRWRWGKLETVRTKGHWSFPHNQIGPWPFRPISISAHNFNIDILFV